MVSTDDVRWDLHAAVSQVRRLADGGALYVSVDVSALEPAYALARVSSAGRAQHLGAVSWG